MALKPCKECGTQISTKAEACPKCGAKQPKPTSIATYIIGAFFILVVINIVRTKFEVDEAAAAAPAKTPAQLAETARKDREINVVLAGAMRLKASMKKPEAFQLKSAMMIGGKTICYEYIGRNSFNDQTAEYYVISDTVSSGEAKDWNRLCAGKTGDDYSSVRAVLP